MGNIQLNLDVNQSFICVKSHFSSIYLNDVPRLSSRSRCSAIIEWGTQSDWDRFLMFLKCFDDARVCARAHTRWFDLSTSNFTWR